MATRSYLTQEALAYLADRGQDTTARVLRNIEQQLEIRMTRDDKGQRVYSPADLELLERVLVLQKAGLHLVEIRGIVVDHDHYMLEFHANSLRRALDLLEQIQQEWKSSAA